MESAEVSKDSAQSPAWSRNASPRVIAASVSVRSRASPAKTSGGSSRISSSTASWTVSSGQTGCWRAGRSRHERGFQSGPEREGVPVRVSVSTAKAYGEGARVPR